MRSDSSLAGLGFQLPGPCSSSGVSSLWSVGSLWESPSVFVRPGPHHHLKADLPQFPSSTLTHRFQPLSLFSPVTSSRCSWTPGHSQEVFSQPWRSVVILLLTRECPTSWGFRSRAVHFTCLQTVALPTSLSFMIVYGRKSRLTSAGP